MRLRLNNPALIPDLIEFLQSRLDMVIDRVGKNEVEVSLLGSYGPDATRLMLQLLVRAWEAGRDAEASVEVVD
jgi:hypothetical protein